VENPRKLTEKYGFQFEEDKDFDKSIINYVETQIRKTDNKTFIPFIDRLKDLKTHLENNSIYIK